MIQIKAFFQQVEKVVLRMVVWGVVLLVGVQGLMAYEPYRLFLSWGERMEGEPLPLPAVQTQAAPDPVHRGATVSAADLVIKVEQYSSLPKAFVMVNGEKIGNFLDNEFVLQVMPADTIEIDASYYNFPVTFTIGSVSDNLSFPAAGQTFQAHQSIVMLGKVILK
ncbi:MAG: hypothetical protein LBK69_08370 [Syntrophomonadaceae bacterium]|nr:hypothetical protein [Syntrophomonadaceae bacterium]